MPFANPTPYDYFPRRLHPQEIGNPFNVINLFFGWENFPAWRQHLDEWKDAALTQGYQLDNKQTLRAFIRYEHLEILIEGVFLIHRLQKTFWSSDIELLHRYEIFGRQDSNEKGYNNAIGCFNDSVIPETFDHEAYNLVYLNEEECKRPMRIIAELWEMYNLPHVRDALYWWLVVSMDYTCADDSRGNDYLIKFHRQLQRVIEAAHLIYIWNMDKWPRLYP